MYILYVDFLTSGAEVQTVSQQDTKDYSLNTILLLLLLWLWRKVWKGWLFFLFVLKARLRYCRSKWLATLDTHHMGELWKPKTQSKRPTFLLHIFFPSEGLKWIKLPLLSMLPPVELLSSPRLETKYWIKTFTVLCFASHFQQSTIYF